MTRPLAAILLLCSAAYAGEKFTLRVERTNPDGSQDVILTPRTDPPPIPVAESPTGYTPKLLWTPQQQAVWNRMRAESHPWMVSLLAEAAKAKNYPNEGGYQVLAFQITGEAKYGRAAWGRIQPVITQPPPNNNFIREAFIEYVLWFDWLTPVLTDAERQQYRDGLDGWARYALAIGTPQYKGGFLVSDSDRTIGQYLALRMLDKLTGSKWCDQLPADVRPAIKRYCEFAKGGEWVESGQYNAGTTQLIAMAIAALGDDAEPELAKYLNEAALAYCYRITPDLKSAYLWGDVDKTWPELRSRFQGCFCLLSPRDSHLRSLIEDFRAANPTVEPSARVLYLWNPYADSNDWRTLPPVHFAEGQGVLTYKTADTMFVAHCPQRMAVVQHEVSWASDFWLWQDGEWKVGHPTAYQFIAPANTLKTYGLQSMFARGWTDWGKTDSGVWITCNTSGPFYKYGSYPKLYYDPPPSFVEKAQRTIRFEMPGKITVIDDVKASPPTRLDRYRPVDFQQIDLATPVASVIYDGASLVDRKVNVEVAK